MLVDVEAQAGEDVSIHAPPEGRDQVPWAGVCGGRIVSIHAPPEGRDLQQLI